MVDQQFFTQQELEELFGKLEATPDARIFQKYNVNGEYAQGQQFYVTAVHFQDRQKRSYYAVNIDYPNTAVTGLEEVEAQETAFKKIQEACQLVEDTGNWPVPF